MIVSSDVEGSAKPLHELSDAHAAALHEHRRPLREAFRAQAEIRVLSGEGR